MNQENHISIKGTKNTKVDTMLEEEIISIAKEVRVMNHTKVSMLTRGESSCLKKEEKTVNLNIMLIRTNPNNLQDGAQPQISKV